MGNHKNIIELNGKHYDALTGHIVEQTQDQKKNQPRHTTNATGRRATDPSAHTHLDGFSHPKKTKMTSHSPAPSHHQKTERSKTLMRRAVQKPHPIVKQPSHAPKPAVVATGVAPVAKTTHLNHARFLRAEQVAKSKLVSKFSGGGHQVSGRTEVVPVVPAPEPTQHVTYQHDARNPFQVAIDAAQSHTQPKLHKPRTHHRVAKKLHVSPRVMSLASGSLAVLFIGGFIAYQNMPNLAVRVASARSGVPATLPGYKPAGFAVSGPIQHKPGQITISFKSNSDADRRFAVTQSTSSWNSEALLENFVATNSQQYQTYESNGKTIYLYGGSNATWVDGGVWYKVEGNSSLNSDQLLRLADSI